MFVRDGELRRLRVIGSVLQLIDGWAERDALLAAMTAPTTQIVSLTIYRKGLWLQPCR